MWRWLLSHAEYPNAFKNEGPSSQLRPLCIIELPQSVSASYWPHDCFCLYIIHGQTNWLCCFSHSFLIIALRLLLSKVKRHTYEGTGEFLERKNVLLLDTIFVPVIFVGLRLYRRIFMHLSTRIISTINIKHISHETTPSHTHKHTHIRTPT